jgi:hypothetical protein
MLANFVVANERAQLANIGMCSMDVVIFEHMQIIRFHIASYLVSS